MTSKYSGVHVAPLVLPRDLALEVQLVDLRLRVQRVDERVRVEEELQDRMQQLADPP